jgi:ribose transport system permease protein
MTCHRRYILGPSLNTAVLRRFRQLPMLPVIAIVFVWLSITVDGFMSVPNLQNIMRQLSVVLVASAGETLVLLIGGIDLSVGAVIGLSAVCGAFTMHATGSILGGLAACLLVGACIGAGNGVAIAWTRVQSFIMTFGMMLAIRAIALLLTGGLSMGRLPKDLLAGGLAAVFGLPVISLVGLAITLLVGLVLSKTTFGQSIYLLGSNPKAAFFSGLDVRKLTLSVYILSGSLAGLAGFMLMMRLGAAIPTAGDPLLLQIVAAVVLGGTSLSGGDGGVFRTMTGCVLIAILDNCLELYGAEFWDQMIVLGILIAVGAGLGEWLTRRGGTQPAKR